VFKKANSSLPNEEDISSLVRRDYKALPEGVLREKSGDSAGNSSNVEKEFWRIFEFPVLVHSKLHCTIHELSFAGFPFQELDPIFPFFPLLPLLP